MAAQYVTAIAVFCAAPLLSGYQQGLAAARRAAGRSIDAIEPAWGLPELLMALAGASLRATPPDAAAAERYANEALSLVPYWRTLREGMLPRIARAQP